MTSNSPLLELIINAIDQDQTVDQLDALPQNISKLTKPLLEYNPIQQEAILQAMNTPDFYLIQGPAGTGKTSVIIEIVNQLVQLGKSVLVSAFTNMAIDNVAIKLHQHNIDFIRLGRSYPKDHPLYPYHLTQQADKFREFTHQRSGKVFLSTTTTIGKSTFDDLFFDYVLIDEAAQMTIPNSLMALLHGERGILVGDHAQLQPIVISEEASEKGLSISLFEKLASIHHRFTMLTDQYRMNDEILKFPNEMFYDGKLQSATEEIGNHTIGSYSSQILQNRPYEFIAIETERHDLHQQSNPVEANLVAGLVFELLEQTTLDKDDIGIIAPFRAQVALIRQLLPDMDVDTVDRFQGSEKAVIVLSTTTVLDIPLLSDERRINVALTRAQKKLIVLQTNPSSIRSGSLMRAMYRDAYRRGTFQELQDKQLKILIADLDQHLKELGTKSIGISKTATVNYTKLLYYNSIALVPIKLDTAVRCLICYQQTKRGVQCPGCGYSYHEIELIQWVEQRNKCPTCKHHLSIVQP